MSFIARLECHKVLDRDDVFKLAAAPEPELVDKAPFNSVQILRSPILELVSKHLILHALKCQPQDLKLSAKILDLRQVT